MNADCIANKRVHDFRTQYAEYPSISNVDVLTDAEVELLYKFCFKRHQVASPAYKMAKVIFNTALYYMTELPHSWYRSEALTQLWHSKNPAVAGLFD